MLLTSACVSDDKSKWIRGGVEEGEGGERGGRCLQLMRKAWDETRKPAARAQGKERERSGAQDGPKGPQEASPEGPERLNMLIFHCVFQCFLHFRLFGFPTLQNGPRGPEDRPKTAQEAPKTASRRPQTASRRP